MSFSYAQGTSLAQDVAALRALDSLVATYLPDVRSHKVIYMYMGIFPSTLRGSTGLINDCIQLAKIARAERIIVKTPVESERIPSMEENLASLEFSHYCTTSPDGVAHLLDEYEMQRIVKEATSIIESTLQAGPDIYQAIPAAFEAGILDVPYCIHPNNAGKTKVGIDERGYLCWLQTGNLPVRSTLQMKSSRSGSRALLHSLFYIRDKYDSRTRRPGD
jgi:methylaspartate mutase epsilon subunit